MPHKQGVSEKCQENSTQEYPENAAFAKWRSSEGPEKEQALVELVALMEKHAYSVCWLKIPNHRDEFGGIVNGAVWRAIEGAKGFRGEARFGTWFHRIVLNECNRIFESKQTRETEGLEGLEELGTSSDPESRIYAAEVISKLDADDRRLVDLILQGYTEQEIGEKLGIEQPGVCKRWDKLKERVRDGCRE